MRHGSRVKKLGRKKEHRHALLRNLCRALFIHERIRTTLPKAKQTQRLAERLITFAKRNDLPSKRLIFRSLPDHKLVKVLCDEIGPKFNERKGGYTRIYRLGQRLGDGAEMALLELVEQSDAAVITLRRKLIERRKLSDETIKKEKKKKPKPEKKAKKTEATAKTSKAPPKKKTKKEVKKEKKAKKKARARKDKKKHR